MPVAVPASPRSRSAVRPRPGSPPEPVPALAPEHHDLFDRRSYTLETLPIRHLLHRVEQRVIADRKTGLVVYGAPRVGKTQALDAVEAHLCETLGDGVLVFRLDMERVDAVGVSRNQMYELLLEAVGHEMAGTGSAGEKRRRLINFLTCEALRMRERWTRAGFDGAAQPPPTPHGRPRRPLIVFFVDEAQNLSEANFGTLIHVYNQVWQRRVDVCFILCGQPEIAVRAMAFRAKRTSQRRHILARFLARLHPFYGVREAEEMKDVLEQYDRCEQPEGWPYPRFFFPAAFAAGHRFEDLGKPLFAAFEAARKQAALPQMDEWGLPMEYVVGAVEHICRTYGRGGRTPLRWPTEAVLTEAVVASGYAETELGVAPVAPETVKDEFENWEAADAKDAAE